MATVQERVDASIGVISPKRPNWFNEVDPETVDIQSLTLCVCGQLYGSYTIGLQELTGSTSGSSDYAFTVGDSTRDAINTAWREAIIAHRRAKVEERELVPA